jgi:hypothetical protein
VIDIFTPASRFDRTVDLPMCRSQSGCSTPTELQGQTELQGVLPVIRTPVSYLAVHVQSHNCLALLQAKMALKVPSKYDFERAPRGYLRILVYHPLMKALASQSACSLNLQPCRTNAIQWQQAAIQGRRTGSPPESASLPQRGSTYSWVLKQQCDHLFGATSDSYVYH